MHSLSAFHLFVAVMAALLIHDGTEYTRAIAAVLALGTGIPAALANGGERRA